MSTDRWLRVRQLFDAGRDLPGQDRQAWLEESCAGDTGLLREVRALIEAHEHSGDFLEQPAVVAGAGLGTLEGRRVGPYDVGPRIGSGGMGDVYRAVDGRLNRTVAIKVQSGRVSWRAGFRDQLAHEAQVISALSHPHICTLHDVGHDGPIDYLVMEYVEGEPIDDYCRRLELGAAQRLALFATVCDAVHYAHQHLVVHRDLKPRNILVTATHQPKLLDFGIAKLLSVGGPRDTLTTLSPALTPGYASPEQMRGQAVTTATDVYSLGVVLYELLCGCRPFAAPTASLEEIVRAVCDTEPPAPSVAAREAGAPASIAKALRGDLDTIVLKALRKEPERRYPSAEALADDVRRHLAGHPLDARGDAFGYRLAKWTARHRVAAAVAALFAVTLVTAIGLVLRQSRFAESQRQRAERRFADVRRLAGSFLFEFHDAIRDLPGSTRARELVATRGLEYLDGLAAEAADDPSLRAELARAYQRVGDVQGGFREANLGNVVGALASYRKALALQEALAAASPSDRRAQQDLARTVTAFGDLQVIMRDMPAAGESFRRALAIREALHRTAADRVTQRELGIGHHRVGDAARHGGRAREAVPSLERSIALLEPLAADPNDVDARYALARSCKTLGTVLAQLHDYPKSLAWTQRALRLNQALSAADPLRISLRNEIAMSSIEEGRAHGWMGQLAEALESFRRAEAISASMLAADEGNIQGRWLVGLERNLIGETLRGMQRHEQALVAHQQALTLLESVVRKDGANATYRYNVANTLQLIGDVYLDAARHARGGPARRQAWKHAQTWYGRSAAAFDVMRRQGTLSGNFLPDAEKVQALLARCARELGDAAPAAPSATRPIG